MSLFVNLVYSMIHEFKLLRSNVHISKMCILLDDMIKFVKSTDGIFQNRNINCNKQDFCLKEVEFYPHNLNFMRQKMRIMIGELGDLLNNEISKICSRVWESERARFKTKKGLCGKCNDVSEQSFMKTGVSIIVNQNSQSPG